MLERPLESATTKGIKGLLRLFCAWRLRGLVLSAE